MMVDVVAALVDVHECGTEGHSGIGPADELQVADIGADGVCSWIRVLVPLKTMHSLRAKRRRPCWVIRSNHVAASRVLFAVGWRCASFVAVTVADGESSWIQILASLKTAGFLHAVDQQLPCCSLKLLLLNCTAWAVLPAIWLLSARMVVGLLATSLHASDGGNQKSSVSYALRIMVLSIDTPALVSSLPPFPSANRSSIAGALWHVNCDGW
jgi:hypothetical protein